MNFKVKEFDIKILNYLAVLSLSLFLSIPSYSESVETKSNQWGYDEFCEKTLKSYASAIKDGEGEIIISLLNKTNTFKEISDYKKIAFLKIIENAALNGSEKDSVSLCKNNIKSIKENLSAKKIKTCHEFFSLAVEVSSEKRIVNHRGFGFEAARELQSQYSNLKDGMSSMWLNEIYYSCLLGGQ